MRRQIGSKPPPGADSTYYLTKDRILYIIRVFFSYVGYEWH